MPSRKRIIDAETWRRIDNLRLEVQRDRDRLNASSLGLMFLFQPDEHPHRQMLWTDLSYYPGGEAKWRDPVGRWVCGIVAQVRPNSELDYLDVFFDRPDDEACQKFCQHACEVSVLLQRVGYECEGRLSRKARFVRRLFDLFRDELEWEKNEEPGRPQTKTAIARLKDVYLQTESVLTTIVESFSPTKGGKPAQKALRPPHRPPDTDAVEDARIGDKWLQRRVAGPRISINEFATLHGLDSTETHLALGRDKKRRRAEWAANPPAGKKSVKQK